MSTAEFGVFSACDPLLGSAWRSEHLCSGFGLPRPACPESIEACVEQRSRARALAAVCNAPDAQARSHPAAPRAAASEQAWLASSLSRYSRDARPRFLPTALASMLTDSKAPMWSETSK